MRSLSQAIDLAIKEHESKYKESKVYAAYAVQEGSTYTVELRASHFCTVLGYRIHISD